MPLAFLLLAVFLAAPRVASPIGVQEHAPHDQKPATGNAAPASGPGSTGGFISPLAPFEAKFRSALLSGNLDAIPTVGDIQKAVQAQKGKSTIPPDKVESEMARAQALAAALKAGFQLKAIAATSGVSKETLLPPVNDVVVLLGEPKLSPNAVVGAILTRLGKNPDMPSDDAYTLQGLKKGRIGVEHLADMAVLMSGQTDPNKFRDLLSLRIQPVREAMTWLSVYGPKAEENPDLRRDLERVDQNLDATWNAAYSLLDTRKLKVAPEEAARRVEAARRMILATVEETSSILSRVAQAQLDKRGAADTVAASMINAAPSRVSDLEFLRSLRVPTPKPPRDKVAAPDLDSVELPPGPRRKIQQAALAALSEILPPNGWVRDRMTQLEAKLKGEESPELDGPRQFTTEDGKKLPLEEVARRELMKQCLERPDLKAFDASGELLVTAIKARGHYESDPTTFWEKIRRGKLLFAEARNWDETTPRRVDLPGTGPVTVSYAGLADFDHFTQSFQQGFESPWDTVNIVLSATPIPLVNTRASHDSEAGGNFVTDIMVRTMNAAWTEGKRWGVIPGSVPDQVQYEASARGLALARRIRAEAARLKSFCKAVAAAH